MKTRTFQWLFLVLSVAVFAVACKRETASPGEETIKPPLLSASYDYVGKVPQFPKHSNPNDFSVSNAGATLGRVLFYDKFLSVSNNVSCGSCHLQQNAFAEPNSRSVGFAGGLTPRNTPPIFNLSPQGNFFWDGRATNLEEMVLMPVQHSLEMGMENLNTLAAKLSKVPYYKNLFKNAYGSDDITTQRMGNALAQFVVSIRSTQSPYDKFKAGTLGFTGEQLNGMSLFFDKLHCTTCHKDFENTVDYRGSMFNIGLDLVYADRGRGQLNGGAGTWEDGVFKTPGLRNLKFTAPYMHDGRFANLEQVVEHYNSRVSKHKNLSHVLGFVSHTGWGNNNAQQPKLNESGAPVLDLTDQEKKDLIAFLETLSDESFTKDPRFSDPFNY